MTLSSACFRFGKAECWCFCVHAAELAKKIAADAAAAAAFRAPALARFPENLYFRHQIRQVTLSSSSPS